MSMQILKHKMESVNATQAEIIATANPWLHASASGGRPGSTAAASA
jgi:hypothetical protein